MTARLIPETVVEGKRLGRHVNHDPRSRDFPVRVDEAVTLKKVLWSRRVAPFDQGQLGSCTGNAITGVLDTSPFRAKFPKPFYETMAVSIYEAATLIDNAPGSYPPDDTGSDGLSVCKVAKTRGFISGYTHAFSLAQALQALMSGPVITGVSWYEGFDNPDPSGLVQIAGQVRGGHEFEVLGYDPATDLLTAVNSWGKSWGVSGRFHFTSKTWARLLAEQGDCTVPLP